MASERPGQPGGPERRDCADAAYFDRSLGEFLLPYDAIRCSSDPEAALMAFLQSTYAAAADLGGWDRDAWTAPWGNLAGHGPCERAVLLRRRLARLRAAPPGYQ
jgi:hypothetical protein